MFIKHKKTVQYINIIQDQGKGSKLGEVGSLSSLDFCTYIWNCAYRHVTLITGLCFQFWFLHPILKSFL
jgi:hypothetical protein